MSDLPAISEELKGLLGEKLLSAREEGDGFVVRVAPEAVHDCLQALRDKHGFNLMVDLLGVDWSTASPPPPYGIVGRASAGGAAFMPPGQVGGPAPEWTSATSVRDRVGRSLPTPIASAPDAGAVPAGAAELHGRDRRFEVVYRLASIDVPTGMVLGRVAVKTRLAEGEAMPRSVMDLYGCADWFEREVWDMFGVPVADRPGIKRLLMYEEFKGHPLRKDYPVAKRQPLIGPASGQLPGNPSLNAPYPAIKPEDE